MATPRNNSFAVASGGSVYAGLEPPSSLPAWIDGKPLNEWFAISGTTGAGGAAINAFGGFAVVDDTGVIVVPASGGHLDSSDNRVVSLDLEQDSPSWLLREATPNAPLDGRPSAVGDRSYNVSHYADGRPTSRHLYRHPQYLPQFGRVMLIGCRGEYAAETQSFPNVDAFNLETNLWDPANTFPSSPYGNRFGEARDADNNVWTASFHRFRADGTWDFPATTGTSAESVRTPLVYDPGRDYIICLQWRDGFGSGTAQINCTRLNRATMVRSVITINASAAKTQFEADQPEYAGADYCPDNGKILFYAGGSGAVGRMYWLTPNTGTNWDLEIATFGGGSATIPATATGGINGRLRYIPKLKGFVLMPSSSAGLYFMRTA